MRHKLYYFPIAPNPTRVRLYLAEKRLAGGDVAVDEQLVSIPDGEQRAPDHLARNPFGKLPVLELPDGSFLIESLAIIEYLEELSPAPAMIGSDPIERARTREAERIAELGVLAPVARIVHATKSPLGLPPNPAVAEQARGSLVDPLRALDERLSDGRPFVCGERPTVADCTLAAGLQFGRFGDVVLPGDHPHLDRWDAAYRERESARSVLVR